MRLRPKKSFYITIFTIITIVLLSVGLFYGVNKQDKKLKKEPAIHEKSLENLEKERLEKTYQEQTQTNEDYLGRLFFESKLIDLPFVKSEDNNDYLNQSFTKEKSNEGTIFLDYRNKLSDQNMILYGHLVYYDEKKMFSPLHKLKEEKNYQKNSNLMIEFKNEIRTYKVAYIYYYSLTDREMKYWLTNYDDKFDSYISLVNSKSFYNTGIKMTKDDSFITLQTCVKERDDLRLIVIAKEIKRQKF